MMKKKILLGFVAGGLLVVLCALSSYAAAPEITKLELTGTGSSVVPANHYIILPDSDAGFNGAIIIEGGDDDSDDALDNNLGGALVKGSATMGEGSVTNCFGALLMDVTGANIGDVDINLVTNHTDEFLGAANYPEGPVNVANISTSLELGTELRVTVDLNGNKPHFVGILGTDATVEYDGADELKITAKTVGAPGTTNEAGQPLTSYFGFCINSNDGLFENPLTPLKLIGQTNIWVGDFNLFVPGSDSNSDQGSGSAGSWGSSNALAGFTAWGPTGETRNASIFIPDDSVEDIFGTGVTNAMLTGFINNSQVTTTVTEGTNFDVLGRTYVFNYTFASGKDNGIGVASAAAKDDDDKWYECAIATASYGTPMAEEIKALSTFRDEYLLTNKPGRVLVSTYERISPPIANFIRDKEALKAIIRTGLKPLVKVADHLTSK